ncbi:MAG: hypothetical protein RIR79_1295 [Pseudomonadota bacterium]
MWRSLVAHLHGVQGVEGSNPFTPTIMKALERWMSGLSHTPGKRAWGKTHRGFESRLLRQYEE